MYRCSRLRMIFLLLSVSLTLCAQTAKPDLVLQGEVTGAQNKTYIEIPFDVPAGVRRLSVDFTYTGKEQHTALDLGIEDPVRFRGNSGGNKSHFTLSESDATPSYLPGPIPSGKWKLLISVPNIRPAEHSTYRAEIRFNSAIEGQGFTQTPLVTGQRWYRGDLHMHTAHSDGSCASQSGRSVPCPLFLTAQTAVARGLDFIAITDHNATSQYDAMRELQPYFDRLLLIPGREITTFWGHFNIYGVTQYVDYRAVPGGRNVDDIVRDVRAKGGIASVNHADSPDGEICMGCGWKPPDPVDMSLFAGVEVINGGRIMLSSADFWDRSIAGQVRLTAIGGSDNHNGPAEPNHPGSIGIPTTVVDAAELSVPAILDGIRKGRVFIDLTGSRDRQVDIEAYDSTLPGNGPGKDHVRMGGVLQVPAGHSVSFVVQIAACPRATAVLFLDGHETPVLPPLKTSLGNENLPFSWTSDGNAHWLRAEVRDSNGSLMLVSNPIYINFPSTEKTQ
jgi:hypothetical protein